MTLQEKRSGYFPERRGKTMKKLFALMLALCLLCGTAMAEVAAELTWDASLEESGTTQEINIGDAAKLLYWIPNQLPAIDPATVQCIRE